MIFRESLQGLPRQLDDYELLREIGRGGSAVVYEATQRSLARRVALKLVVTGPERPRAIARLRREARLASSLSHPHVATVFDLRVGDACAYVVMELADQGTLAAHVHERPMPLARALDLLLPIFSAVAYAHDRGVVHRDIKPANILLTFDRFGKLHPKLSDFGIGKSVLSDVDRITGDEALLGTLPYMPPEQLLDPHAAAEPADQYALAIILYRAITGRLPYGASALPPSAQASSRDATRPSAVRSELPTAIDEILARALSPDPGARFPSVRSFAGSLLPFADGPSWGAWSGDFGTGQELTADLPDGLPPAVARKAESPPQSVSVRSAIFVGAVLSVTAWLLMRAPASVPFLANARAPKTSPADVAVPPAAPGQAIPALEPTAEVRGAAPEPSAEASARAPSGVRLLMEQSARHLQAAKDAPASSVTQETRGPNHAPIFE